MNRGISRTPTRREVKTGGSTMVHKFIRLLVLVLIRLLMFGLALGLLVGCALCLYISVTMNMDTPVVAITGRMLVSATMWFCTGGILGCFSLCCFALSMVFVDDARTAKRPARKVWAASAGK
ncbi:MAG: hypothetical protein WA239_10570 [Candidatus Sulfotelmatobacter sp.]